jgi:hypothetical protein
MECSLVPLILDNCTIGFGPAAAWAGASVTLLAVLVALFKDPLREWWGRPKLRCSMSRSRKVKMPVPGALKRTVSNSAPGYFFRCEIGNEGRAAAKRAHVFAAALSKKAAGGLYVAYPLFIPANLLWAQYVKTNAEEFRDISPGTARPCDLGFTIVPNRAALFGAAIESAGEGTATLSIKLSGGAITIGPGSYRLHVVVGADNAASIRGYFNIDVTGKWSDSPDEMLTDGVCIEFRRE